MTNDEAGNVVRVWRGLVRGGVIKLASMVAPASWTAPVLWRFDRALTNDSA